MMAEIAVFWQETGEEGIVHLSSSYTLRQAIEDHPEWRYRYTETLKDSAYYRANPRELNDDGYDDYYYDEDDFEEDEE